MNDQNPLDNLKDIHLPEAISSWPPAPGWWILAILLLTLVGWAIWKLWEKYQQRYLLRASLTLLAQLNQDYLTHQDPQQLIKQYSSLLRRVALAKFPRHQVASLTGADWLNFLDNSIGKPLFNSAAGQMLLQAPYQKPGTIVPEIDQLNQTIETWIKAINYHKFELSNLGNSGAHHD